MLRLATIVFVALVLTGVWRCSYADVWILPPIQCRGVQIQVTEQREAGHVMWVAYVDGAYASSAGPVAMTDVDAEAARRYLVELIQTHICGPERA